LGASFVALPARGANAGLAKTFASFVALLQPNVSIGLIARLGRNRTTLAIAGGALLSYAVGAVTMGWTWPVTYAALIRSHQAGERFSGIQLTPASIAYGLGASARLTTLVAVLAAVGTLLAGIAIWRRVSEGTLRFAAFSALTPFVAAFVHQHDLVSTFPAAVWCALRTRGTNRFLGALGTLLVAVDWFGQAQRPNAIAQSALLAIAALAAFGAIGDARELRAVLPAAAVVTVLFCGAAWLATAYPAPVWPYHLGPFSPPAVWPIARVWQQEQQRDGLQAAIPAWSILRALSLAGCGLLAAAIYRRPSYCQTAIRCSDESS